MWFFSKKKKQQPVYENAYSVLNKELQRMHDQFTRYSKHGSSDAAAEMWKRIQKIQDQLFVALEKQPMHSEEIRDLQNTVADILLLTETESK